MQTWNDPNPGDRRVQPAEAVVNEAGSDPEYHNENSDVLLEATTSMTFSYDFLKPR